MEDYKNEFYTVKFRKSFLKLLIQDRSSFDIFSPYLYESAFQETDLKIIYKCIKSIRKKHDINYIQQGTLESEVVDFCISKSINDQVFLETVKEIYDLDILQNEEVIIEKARKWVLRERLIKAISQSVDILKENNDEPEKILTLVQNAITTELDATSYADFKSFDNLLEDIQRERGSDVVVSTGFPTLDKYFQGGYGAGLHIVLGGAKAGKSTFCVQLSVNALKQYKSVVYCSLELSQTLVKYKFACCMAGLKYNEVIQYPELYQERMRKFYDVYKPKLFIKKFPANKTDVWQIRGFIQSLISQDKMNKVDLIIFDYDDLLKPTIFKKDDYAKAEQQILDLISLKEYFQCPVITPAQVNRIGWQVAEEGSILTSAHLAKSAAKRMHCDSIITLNRQSDEDVIIYLDTTRFGVQDVQVQAKCDLEKNRFIEWTNGKENKCVPDIDDEGAIERLWEMQQEKCLSHQKTLDNQQKNEYKEEQGWKDNLLY